MFLTKGKVMTMVLYGDGTYEDGSGDMESGILIERFYENFVQGNVNNLTEVLINYKNNFCEVFYEK